MTLGFMCQFISNASKCDLSSATSLSIIVLEHNKQIFYLQNIHSVGITAAILPELWYTFLPTSYV
jgi:hypothetical protein